MAALSTYAEKLLAWFRIYNINPSVYNNDLTPKAQRRGRFVSALSELVAYESQYGYFSV